MADYHYHDDGGRGIGFLVIFLAVLLIIILAITAKLFIIAGIIAIAIGIFGIFYGLREEEILPVVYGTIYCVVGLCAIFLGTWLSGFLDSSGATAFLQNIFGVFKK